MLKKLYRLNKTKDIQTLMKTGRAFYSPILMVKAKANELAHSRFAIIVSNKVSKKATQRNLIKRRLREIVRLQLAKLETGADVAILASAKMIDAKGKVLEYQDMAKEVEAVFKKARLYENN
jgi:ribonuclease P protein component